MVEGGLARNQVPLLGLVDYPTSLASLDMQLRNIMETPKDMQQQRNDDQNKAIAFMNDL